jgi:hypothetical protein
VRIGFQSGSQVSHQEDMIDLKNVANAMTKHIEILFTRNRREELRVTRASIAFHAIGTF